MLLVLLLICNQLSWVRNLTRHYMSPWIQRISLMQPVSIHIWISLRIHAVRSRCTLFAFQIYLFIYDQDTNIVVADKTAQWLIWIYIGCRWDKGRFRK